MERVLGWQPQITLEEGTVRYTRWIKRTPGALPAWLRAEAGTAHA
ncbi:hypothetical protein OG453_38380 [Streptomyces sp. NBC_01381]|nr:hypothetical protein [Streptomyces sp. NBC_01381]MCX4672456.1 hypothetical protein [Streptomyces sp. NBC_01381]